MDIAENPTNMTHSARKLRVKKVVKKKSTAEDLAENEAQREELLRKLNVL